MVIIAGCGHPTIELIVQMVRRISDKPIHVIGGGLHFQVTGGRGNRFGIQFQTLIGTGKPAWRKITDDDLSATITVLNSFKPQKVFLSAHDSCDHSLSRMQEELDAETQVFRAGQTYRFGEMGPQTVHYIFRHSRKYGNRHPYAVGGDCPAAQFNGTGGHFIHYFRTVR